MMHGIVTHYDGRTYPVLMGLGEDVAAPRKIAVLVKAGWPDFDQTQTAAIKAWLAGLRQGDIDRGLSFEVWSETVQDLELLPSREQVETALAADAITEEQAAGLLARLDRVATGEAGAPPA